MSAAYKPHEFKIGDRVRNGSAGARVVELLADDFLVVEYDNALDLSDRVIECSCYFVLEEGRT